MPIKRLTEEGVAKLKSPTAGQVDYYDAGMPGLMLRVNYGGAKVWQAPLRITTTNITKAWTISAPQVERRSREGPSVLGRSAEGDDTGR